jgi:L-2-hydroxyglutarate oxidase
MKSYDLIIIGGGIIGTSTAMALSKSEKISLAVMESEEHLAFHQSGHNSGVIHSGIYYQPGTLKARLCTEGREALYDFCNEHEIPHERCGKVIVATNDKEEQYLDTLMERGKTNGMKNIQKVDEVEIKKHEPHVSGIAGIYVPYTGIVDFIKVVEKYADIIRQNGGEIHLNSRVTGITCNHDIIHVKTINDEFQCKHIINCAGLYSDRVARMAGMKPDLQIIPFRGEYYNIKPEKRYLVKNLIYPVPDPRFPFLGVHFTRTVYGEIEAGPNAVLALSRDAYKKTNFSLLELANMATYGGFWKMAKKYWQTGLSEYYRSLDKTAFVRSLNKLLPDLEENDIVPGGSGIRAQALERDGSLVDDFRIVEAVDMIHVLNAPSPAATASIRIGEYIADLAKEKFQL